MRIDRFQFLLCFNAFCCGMIDCLLSFGKLIGKELCLVLVFLCLSFPGIASDKETITVTADNKSRLYTADNPVFSMSFSKNGITIDDIDVLPTVYCEATPTSDAGNYPIVLSGGSDEEYDFEFVQGILTVEKLISSEVELEVSDTLMVYNGFERNYEYNIKPGFDEYGRIVDINTSLVQVQVTYPSLSSDYNSPKNVGSYQVKVLITDPNVIGTKMPLYKYMDIEKAPLLVKGGTYRRLYKTPNPPFQLIYESLLGDDTPEDLDFVPDVACSAEENSFLGDYPIEVTVGEDSNYDTSSEDGVLTIYDPNSEATLSLESDSFVYDGLGKHLEYTITPDFDVEITYNGSKTLPIDAGVYNVVATVVDKDYIGNPLSSDAELVITQAPLHITADDFSKLYLEPINVELSMSFGVFQNGETSSILDELPSITTSVTDESLPGDYPVTLLEGKDNNYYYILHDGVFTVKEEEFRVSITINDRSVAYTGKTVPMSVKVYPSDYAYEISYNESLQAPSSVGSYTVVATVTDPRVVGEVKSDQAILDITPAALTIKANDLEKVYSQENPVLTMNYYGLVGGDHGISEAPNLWTKAEQFTDVGSHDINIEGGFDENYAIALEPGVMSIANFPVIITFEQLEFTFDGTGKELVPITNPKGIEVVVYYNGSLTPPSAVGDYDVRAVVTETNYEGEENTIMEIDPKIIEFDAVNLIIINSSSSPIFKITDVDNYTNNYLKMYDRRGAIVYQQENYSNDFSMREYPNGTYFYVFSYEVNGKMEFEKSFVEVIHQ